MISRFEQARRGDPEATEAVVAALRPRLARMALYYARRSGEDADDLLQEAWVGLLEALPELDTRIGSPDQYLIQRARWRLLDAVKRGRVRRCLPLDEMNLEGPVGTALEAAMAELCLWEFVSRLKPTQRAVLACLLAGLTWRETGHALGCTSANVAYHVRQIRRQYVAWNGRSEAASGGARGSRLAARSDERSEPVFTASREPRAASREPLFSRDAGLIDRGIGGC